MTLKIRKYFIIFGIIGPVFYFALLSLLGYLWNGYDPITTGMSEIGAVDSPFKNIMNFLGFSFLGVSIILFSLGIKSYFGKNLQIFIASILLVVGGFIMFLVGFFPCDPGCIDVTQTGKLHSLTSTVTAILIPFGIMTAAYPITIKWNKKWGYFSFYIGVLSLACGPIMFIPNMNNYTGLIQRIGIGFSLFWIIITSLKIYKEVQKN